MAKATDYRIKKTLENPSTADVIAAFARAFDNRKEPFYMKLQIEGFGAFTVGLQLTQLGYESGAPGMFIIQGNLHIDGEQQGIFEGFYDANERSGYLRNKR